MHNGLIGKFKLGQRNLTLAIDPDLFSYPQGSKGSQGIFFLIMKYGL